MKLVIKENKNENYRRNKYNEELLTPLAEREGVGFLV